MVYIPPTVTTEGFTATVEVAAWLVVVAAAVEEADVELELSLSEVPTLLSTPVKYTE